MSARLATAAATALTAALLMPTAPASAATLIVDATDPGFSASGNWGTSSWNSQKYGDHYRFATPYTGGSDPAWFEFAIPSTGNYDVDVWYPSDSGYNNKAPFVVNTSSGNQSVVVDQRYNGGKWVRLGTFPLDAGTYDAVGVSRWTNGTGYIVADAVRITTAGSAPVWALPLPKSALPRSEYDDPHHDYPAIDLPVWTGTPAYAIRAGTITIINDSSCGRGINLNGTDGAVYTYCHFDSWTVSNGASVVAGQQIGVTGNTGNSTGPHLHFGVRTSGVLRCPQNMLLAIYDGVTPPPATSLPTSGCYY
jgi:murein DD-endopeptidase MepM/ murein hydrolase activator NlpD